MGRGAGRSSPAGVLPWGVGEWPDPSPEHGPETPWGCPSGKCGPCPERRAGPALASQTRAACAWGQPQSCPRVLMPHPTLSLAPSVLSNSGLEPVLWGHGDGDRPHSGSSYRGAYMLLSLPFFPSWPEVQPCGILSCYQSFLAVWTLSLMGLVRWCVSTSEFS